MLDKHPLQTKSWAEFRKEWGNKVFETNAGLLIATKIPFSRYSVGTIIRGQIPTKDQLRSVFAIAQKNNIIFIKFEPYEMSSPEKQKELKKLGLVPGKNLFTPTSFFIDLTKDKDSLIKSFSSKTRYNIKLAQKQGVSVQIDNSDLAFKKYLDLTTETNKRHGFYSHTPKYHNLMWKHLKGKVANLLVAKYKGEIISSWILFKSEKFLYYPYGASTDKYKGVMANNLMMWEAILFGQKNNLKVFDLWGREEGKGFTRFKEGYNPKVIEFVGSWDLIINRPLYLVYKYVDKFRWFLLRLKPRI